MTVESTTPKAATAPTTDAADTGAPDATDAAEGQEASGEESLRDFLASDGEEEAQEAPAPESDSEDSEDDEADEAETDEEKSDKEGEDQETKEEPKKKETKGERRARILREANERTEQAEQRITAKQKEVDEAFTLLSDANEDVEQYEVALVQERARFDRLLQLAQASGYLHDRQQQDLLDYSALTAANKAREAIGQTTTQVRQAATAKQKTQNETWKNSMVQSVQAVTSALGVDVKEFVAYARPFIERGQMDTPASVGAIAKTYLAQQAAPTLAATPDSVEHVARRVDRIKSAPSVITPTDTARPGYSRDLAGWQEEMLKEA